MLLHKELPIYLSIVCLLAGQKYGYISAMEMVPHNPKIEKQLAYWAQKYTPVGDVMADTVNVMEQSPKYFNAARVNLIKTLLENHTKHFPNRPFMGHLERYNELQYIVNGTHNSFKQPLTDKEFEDGMCSLFAALVFRSAGWWPIENKLEDIFNRKTQVFNPAAKYIVKSKQQAQNSDGFSKLYVRPVDPQNNFKRLYFRFQELDLRKLRDFLYPVNVSDKNPKIIDENTITSLLVMPDNVEGIHAGFFQKNLEGDCKSIFDKFNDDEMLLKNKAKAKIDILKKNILDVKTALENDKDSSLINAINKMVFSEDRNNQSTDLTNGSPNLIYRFLKKKNLGAASICINELDQLLQVIEQYDNDVFTCLIVLNSYLANAGSLLKSIQYFQQNKAITERIMRLIWLLAQTSKDNRFVACMQTEWQVLKNHLDEVSSLIQEEITGARTVGIETNPSAVRFHSAEKWSVNDLLRYNDQKSALLTFIIEASERIQLESIKYILQKLATKSDSDQKLDLLERLLEAETDENIATINAGVDKLPQALEAPHLQEFPKLEVPKMVDKKDGTGQGKVKTEVGAHQKPQDPVAANEGGSGVVHTPATPPVVLPVTIPAAPPAIPLVVNPAQPGQSQGAGNNQLPSSGAGTGNPLPTGTPTPWLQWFWNGAVTFFTFLKNKLLWWR